MALRGGEVEYLSSRDWYLNQLSIIAQFEEALHQAKDSKNEADVREFGNKIHGVNSRITDYRNQLRDIGAASFAEAFALAARTMLDYDVFVAIDREAARLIGRERHEFKKPVPK
jgi:hypothetical protein